jgi:hypothetical protein
MPDLEISKLPPISGALLQAADPLAIADLSASETKSVTVKELVQGGIALIDDNSIPGEKIDFTVPPGSIGTLELADKSVTAPKLADQSTAVVDLALPATGAYIGQLGYNEDTGKLYIWDGTTWQPFKAAGSVNTLTYDNTLGPLAIGGVVTDDNVELGVVPKDTTSGGLFLAGPTTTGGTVDYRRIFSVDLPTASTEKGAVAVNGNGLKMVGDAIAIDNAVDPSGATFGVVRYDAYGLVVEGREITSADLPVATISNIGAIRPGPSFGVSADGELTLSNSVTPATATKVTYNENGLITAGANLSVEDIPDLPADKIVNGQLPESVIADRSIEEIKLADYSTCYIQEGNPGSGSKLGQFWFTPSTNQLRVYARGSGPEDIWLSVGFGALQAQNLRWAGTIDADTSTIVSLTSIGVSEGLTAGGPIPAPIDALSGVYFVTQVPGSNISEPNVGSDTFTEGDWLLCIDQAQGWTHIDAGATGGGGGSGGARYLDDLLDVTIGGNQGPFGIPRIALAAGQLLQYDAISGQWLNNDVVNGGTY